ncbi:MAG: hypothetical protein EU541_04205 [Promethearchaeota archaeon]|nr:MAG: hypothetical protein EU541_04205 [Candidatus Lokiarchaeota archaeon]
MSLFNKIKNRIYRLWLALGFHKNIPTDSQNILYIINNYPNKHYTPERIVRLKYLIRLNFPNIRIKSIHFTELEKLNLQNSIGIILSGSSFNVSDFSHNQGLKKKFEREINLIRNGYTKPILGICFGHQLTAYAFNGEVRRMDYKPVSNNVVKIDLKSSDFIIPYKNVLVNLNHSDYVPPEDGKLQKQFIISATHLVENYETVQYMLHKQKPIFSVQFHPENHISNFHYPTFISDKTIDKAKVAGEKIITNFVSLCLRNFRV